MQAVKRLAVVTGANRGLGLGTAKDLCDKGYEVILTSRDAESGEKAASQLKCHFFPLDVNDPKSINDLAAHIAKNWGRLDVLVNNAGILPEKESAFDTAREDLLATFTTNVLGPFALCQKLAPLMRKNGYGRIVNVSSQMGQLSEMSDGYASYRISKTALNAVTRIFSQEVLGEKILVNSVCPGWVRTDMGGAQASRSIEQGVFSIVWAATLPDDGPTGGYFRDGKPLAW